MSKYIGPLFKKIGKGRKNKTVKRWKRESVYGLNLKEKNKLAISYGGLRDYQLKNIYKKELKLKKNTNFNLFKHLEIRIDSIIFSSGLANTIFFARKLVSDRNFLVSTKKGNQIIKTEIVKTPSYRLKIGQIISFKKNNLIENIHIKKSLGEKRGIPKYIDFDKKALTIAYLREPQEDELKKSKEIGISFIADYYSRKI